MDVSQDSWISGKIHQDNWSEAVVRIEFKNVQTAGRKQEHRPKTEKSFLQTLTQLLCHFESQVRVGFGQSEFDDQQTD